MLFVSFVHLYCRGLYTLQPKAFVGKGYISGPKIKVSIQPNANKPVALEVEYDRDVSYRVGDNLTGEYNVEFAFDWVMRTFLLLGHFLAVKRLTSVGCNHALVLLDKFGIVRSSCDCKLSYTDFKVKVIAEDETVMVTAKSSSLMMKICKVGGSPQKGTKGSSFSDTRRKNDKDGVFFFRQVFINLPATAVDFATAAEEISTHCHFLFVKKGRSRFGALYGSG